MTEAKRPGRPPGCAKTGGRKPGSLDKQARTLINDQLANDILSVYKKLGGVKFLLNWAEANPSEFIRQCWARLAPAFPRDGADVTVNTQVNVDATSEMEAGRRVAYLLASAAAKLDLPAEPPVPRQVIEQDPLPAPVVPIPEPHAVMQPLPMGGAHGPAHRDYAAWANSLRQTDAEREDANAVHGSSAEQGVGGLRSGVSTEPPQVRGRRR